MNIIRCDDKKLLLGYDKNTTFAKYILVRDRTCYPHFLVKTDNLQHPDCVDVLMTRNYTEIPVNTNKYSRGYDISPGVGIVVISMRWVYNHAPYPEIEAMESWLFGIYLGSHVYPLAASSVSDDYDHVATVRIESTGEVFVNNQSAGIWLEMLNGE